MSFHFKKQRKTFETFETKDEYEFRMRTRTKHPRFRWFKKSYLSWIVGSACLGFLGGSVFCLYSFRPIEALETLTIEVREDLPTQTTSFSPTLILEWSASSVKSTKDQPCLSFRLEETTHEMTCQDSRWTQSLDFETSSIPLEINHQRTVVLRNLPQLKQQQSLVLTEREDGNYQLIHQLALDSSVLLTPDHLSYDFINQEGKIVETLSPTYLSTQNHQTIGESVVSSSIEKETLLFVRVNLRMDDVLYRFFIAPTLQAENLTQSDSPQSLAILNKNHPRLTLKSYHFFAESLHLKLTDTHESIATYQLVSPYQQSDLKNYYEEANKGILLTELPLGEYFLYANNQPIHTTHEFAQIWYTLPRQGKRKKVTLFQTTGLLSIRVESVQDLPDDIYDLIIDPGHGEPDTGASHEKWLESTEVLKISRYLKERFESYGLKVKLTRDQSKDSTYPTPFNYEKSPYLANGRVDQVYRYQANYLISNHLNALNKKQKGLEVYSSIVTDDRWSRSILTAFSHLDRTIQDNLNSPYRVSEGSYKRYYNCPSQKVCLNPYVDYLYMIRETGGALTYPITLTEFSQTFQTIPSYGAESLLIEYAYLDHPEDRELWLENWQEYGEAVVEGTLNYLNIRP